MRCMWCPNVVAIISAEGLEARQRYLGLCHRCGQVLDASAWRRERVNKATSNVLAHQDYKAIKFLERFTREVQVSQ